MDVQSHSQDASATQRDLIQEKEKIREEQEELERLKQQQGNDLLGDIAHIFGFESGDQTSAPSQPTVTGDSTDKKPPDSI